MLLEVLIGIAMSIITQVAKKTKIDGKYIIAVLSIILGGIYFFVKKNHPEIVEEVMTFTIGIYGISQVVYNYIIKRFEKDKKEETK